MIKNYLRSAFKNLFKNRVITAINLIGLAIGITGLFLVLVFTSHEESYDTFYPEYDRIYRVCQREMSSEGESVGESTAPPLALELQSTIPEIENSCRYLQMSTRLITGPNHSAYEDQYNFIDASFFNIFSIPVIQGKPEEAIQNSDNLVITKRIAVLYFGTTDVIGKTLKVRDQDLTVGAVIENPPSYSHFQYDILRTIYTIDNEQFHSSAWLWHAIETYVKLRPDAHLEQVQEKVYKLSNGGAIEQFKDAGLDYTFFLQPLSMIHKEVLTDNGIVTSSSARNVIIFQLLGIFVLFLACLNFINMTLALYFKRIKEVSIRKVLGAFPRQVFQQFLLESMLTIIIAGIFSIICIELILPSFLNFTGIPVSYLQEIPFSKILFFIMIVILSGIVAGIYPAMYASSRTTARTLGHKKAHFVSKILRPVLVILQFTISIVIIIVMLSMKQQITFMQSKNLGYDSSHKLVLTMRRETELPQKYETYKDIFSSIPGVNGITSSSTLPGKDHCSYYIESNPRISVKSNRQCIVTV
jgi:putative ABC transport system permease protein